MFEEYLFDADYLRKRALENKKTDERIARRYHRLSIFCLFSALESYINYITDIFKDNHKIDYSLRLFLNDKKLVFSDTKGLIEKDEYHRVEEKIRLLNIIFDCKISFNKKEWSDFKNFKQTRDKLVHSRMDEDYTNLNKYEKEIATGLKSIIYIMNLLSVGIFSKPIRKKILDIIPD